MNKKIEMEIECPSCDGTGIYKGMAEVDGTGVICNSCKGTGAIIYSYSYKDFTGKRMRYDIKRVYLNGCGYKLGLGIINYTNIGNIDMDKEGVSYSEFLDGKMPTHIKKLGCPMSTDQGACHKIKGFTDECNRLNGGYQRRKVCVPKDKLQ